jgi:hypothetical protein
MTSSGTFTTAAMSASLPTPDISLQCTILRDGPLSDIGECLNGENFYSLKEGRAKIVGFLLPAGQATLRSLFGGAMGDVRLGWSGGSRHSSPPAST